MKVCELINSLKQFDGELNILCSSEDQDLLAENHLFRLFEIDNIGIVEGEMMRIDDSVPSIKFGETEYSQKLVVIDLTSSF